MDRRVFLAMTAAAVAVGAPAAAKVPLQELSSYFNGIKTLEAKFAQTAADGARSSGTLYMRRPGRARFEYDPPEESLVMAGGGKVAVFDGRSNSVRPEQYPLKRTPLYIILERNVDLARRNMVIGHSGDARTTTLVAQDPDEPQNGRVELIFQNAPLTLAGWRVIDAQGQTTTVQLTQIKLGGQIPARLFSIPQEISSRE
ncbi:MAG: outer membrane lipoprotein carrier protein LolA [Pseudomonadota bacterium]